MFDKFNNLKKIFAEEKNILLTYIFGSQVTGKIGPQSDYDFAQKFAPIAGFRNILIHEYLDIDWDEVYKNLQKIDQWTVPCHLFFFLSCILFFYLFALCF